MGHAADPGRRAVACRLLIARLLVTRFADDDGRCDAPTTDGPTVTDLDSNGAFPDHRSAEPSDPFGTAALRAVVMDAWAASPARFREDANAEEALFVGGYVGRVLVELAANAADAARAAGVPAQLRVRLHGNELRVANSGSPLTPAGVAALSSLRASAKRDSLAAVGHFGVGFTAVLSWSLSLIHI